MYFKILYKVNNIFGRDIFQKNRRDNLGEDRRVGIG